MSRGALRILAVVGRQRQESAVDLPSSILRVRTLVPTPPVEAVPVEEQLPAVMLFLGCELVVRGRRGRLSRDRWSLPDRDPCQRRQRDHPATSSEHRILPEGHKRTSDSTIRAMK